MSKRSSQARHVPLKVLQRLTIWQVLRRFHMGLNTRHHGQAAVDDPAITRCTWADLGSV